MIIAKSFPTIPPNTDFEQDVRELIRRGHNDGYDAACKRCHIGASVDDEVTKANLKGFAEGALEAHRELWPVTPVAGRNWDELYLESYLCGWRNGYNFGCQICGCDPALQSEVAPYLYIPPCTFLDEP